MAKITHYILSCRVMDNNSSDRFHPHSRHPRSRKSARDRSRSRCPSREPKNRSSKRIKSSIHSESPIHSGLTLSNTEGITMFKLEQLQLEKDKLLEILAATRAQHESNNKSTAEQPINLIPVLKFLGSLVPKSVSDLNPVKSNPFIQRSDRLQVSTSGAKNLSPITEQGVAWSPPTEQGPYCASTGQLLSMPTYHTPMIQHPAPQQQYTRYPHYVPQHHPHYAPQHHPHHMPKYQSMCPPPPQSMCPPPPQSMCPPPPQSMCPPHPQPQIVWQVLGPRNQIPRIVPYTCVNQPSNMSLITPTPQHAGPPTNSYVGSKTRLCAAYMRGECSYNDRLCWYSHDTHTRENSQCTEYNTKGTCRLGQKCFYRHVKDSILY
jgi:hypothetical protein